MVSLVDQEFQHELCEFGLYPHKVADVDDDGKPRRTGIALFSLSNTQACIYLPQLKPACNFCTLDHACLLSNSACKNYIYIYIPDE